MTFKINPYRIGAKLIPIAKIKTSTKVYLYHSKLKQGA